ncbi:unnamed protein product [Medioppia subpectinata]|uniref:Carboxylic ester hydrolase n=1 Tax=Medioppia subpectinata TaxID=1979941 RepID=A0A7R9KD56_9ACAR|nr:unnamed protein product [Medioppia subpectinata]CAG2101327.1 unnamed protein product [Medioppia subpectinata]
MFVCCVCDSNSIDVNTSSGSVRGQTLHVLNRKIHQFLNIPYAEPPLGPLRFAPPLPLNAPKQDIIDGTKLGNSCIQRMIIGVNISEDCLVLNIWTANVDNSDDSPSLTVLKPVMFYIYGGGLSLDSIFYDHYNASVLATNDVVVVSVNYRVGPLGFLYGADRTAPGNAGFYDQLLALKWVRENIHAFGGDKDQMTIFGQSAGSWSVSAHILSPLSKGLFKRAIMQSGSLMYNRERPVLNTVEALQKAKQLAKRLNCDQYDYKWLDCLRAIQDPNLFIKVPENGNPYILTHSVFGTEFLPILPQKSLELGLYNSDIELIAGVTANEGTSLGFGLVPEMRAELTEPLFRKAVHDLRNDYHNINVDKVCDHYLKGVHKTNSSQLKAAFRLLLGDLAITCPTYHFAKRLAANGHRVYFYQLSFQCKLFDSHMGCIPGHVCHGADLNLCFGHPLKQQTLFTETEYDFSIDVMKMWTNFAKTGKPHDIWPQLWDKSVIRVKDLNPNDLSLILDNPFESTCDGIWSQYF